MNALITSIQKKMQDTELVMLLVFLLIVFTLLSVMGNILAPLLVSVALAYVLDGVVDLLGRCRMPRMVSLAIVGIGALLAIVFTLLAVIPLLTSQVGRLIVQAPVYVSHVRDFLHHVQTYGTSWINPDYVQKMVAALTVKLQGWGADLLSFSIASIPGLMTLMVYAVLVPVLIFFLLKDKHLLQEWSRRFLPKKRFLLIQVWDEVDVQIGNYIRGKVWETLIVGVVTWLVLWVCGQEYALLLAALTGISVWIPFVGIAVVTVPVVLLTLFQWGATEPAMYTLVAYSVVQLLDANVLVPWMFSGVVNLHPIAIVVAILVFGAFWGVLGVFIAIPMAALVQSVLQVVMSRSMTEHAVESES